MSTKSVFIIIASFVVFVTCKLHDLNSNNRQFKHNDMKHKALNYDSAINIIKDHVVNRPVEKLSKDLCSGSLECCTISTTQSCDASTFTRDVPVLILPGGNTKCIFDSSTPYAFELIPGDADKLYIHYQGGGACWDKVSTTAGLCSTDASPYGLNGIFSRTNPLNYRFKNYTIIQALYCSGDVWGGNITQPYSHNGSPVTQVGVINAQATLDWIINQQISGKLASEFSELVVGGDSAGSIGAQLWGTVVLDSLKWSKAAILPDSYAGVFPEGSEGPLVLALGLCNWNKFPVELLTDCLSQTLTIERLNLYFMQKYPTIPRGFVQSKIDIVQQSFYVAVGATYAPTSGSGEITPDQFYADVNNIFGAYNEQNMNFMTFLIDGDQHTYTELDYFYTADGLGRSDNNASGNDGPLLYQWMSSFPLGKNETARSICIGDLKIPDSRGEGDDLYCATTVIPKEFVQQ